MMDDSVDQPPEIEPEDIICPQCGSGNRHDAEFCHCCAAPLGNLAGVDPLRRTLSYGWLSRRALSGPHRFIVLLGIWLLLAPTAIGCALGCIDYDGILDAIKMGLIAVLASYILFRATRNYLRLRREAAAETPGGTEEDAGDSETGG